MSKWKHRLRGIKSDQRTATCDHCGPVSIVLKGHRWACAVGKREQRGITLKQQSYKYNQTHRFRKYGISQTDYNRMLLQQFNRCKICLTDFNEKRPHIDHDHKSGKVRALLCGPCNTALGMVKEKPFNLARMAAYLKWSGTLPPDADLWEQTDFVDLRVLKSPPSTDEQSSFSEQS